MPVFRLFTVLGAVYVDSSNRRSLLSLARGELSRMGSTLGA